MSKGSRENTSKPMRLGIKKGDAVISPSCPGPFRRFRLTNMVGKHLLRKSNRGGAQAPPLPLIS